MYNYKKIIINHKLTSIILFSIMAINTISANAILSDYCAISYNAESHIIKGVPYIGQETGIDCEICSFTMLVQYLGKNYRLYDIFYLTGSGHTLLYKPISEFKKISNKLSPPCLNPGSISSIWKKDWYLISNITGTECNITYNEEKLDESTKQAAWEEYWNRVKTYINNDVPVYTHIDMSLLTYNKKYKYFKEGSGVCHAIVIVGYNETNGTVCINDPAPAYDGRPEEGMYFYENLSTLREAVENSTKSSFIIYKYGYLTITLEDKSEPMLKEMAYKMVHFRNLAKMDGSPWAYDNIFTEDGNRLGINALKSFKKDMKPLKIIGRIPIWIFIRIGANIIYPNSSANSQIPFYSMPYFISIIKDEKLFTSEALLEIDNCSFCKTEAHLFQNESQKFGEIYDLYDQLVKMIDKKQYIRVIIKTIPIFYKINKIIDEIIEIEEMILNEGQSELK